MTIRLYPSKLQRLRLEQYLFAARATYNRALDVTIYWYEKTGQRLMRGDHNKDLTFLRAADPFWGNIPLVVQRGAIQKLHSSFLAFFRRLKSGKKPGFPRFKSASRWNSVTLNPCGHVLKYGRVRVSGVCGLIRARNVQPLKGKILLQRIIRRAGKWYCHLLIEDGVAAPPPKSVTAPVGVDLGIRSFITLSDGNQIANPRFGGTLARILSRANRRLARTKKGSKRRKKAIARLQRIYERISDARHNFTHHASKAIVRSYDLIAFENLNVSGMSKGRFAKSILDACWTQFVNKVRYKAEWAGCTVVKVDPRGTSQECSRCGSVVEKDLSIRIHDCPGCGLVLDRDHNAAVNILHRGLHRPAVGGLVKPVERFIGTAVNRESSKEDQLT